MILRYCDTQLKLHGPLKKPYVCCRCMPQFQRKKWRNPDEVMHWIWDPVILLFQIKPTVCSVKLSFPINYDQKVGQWILMLQWFYLCYQASMILCGAVLLLVMNFRFLMSISPLFILGIGPKVGDAFNREVKDEYP